MALSVQKTVIEKLTEAILDADRDSANILIDKWAHENSYTNAVTEILEPALFNMGKKWHDKSLAIAQGYVAAKIAEDTLTKALNSLSSSKVKPEKKGITVIGNIEDDCHALGRKMVNAFLRLSGWEVYDLGNDVMANEFVDKALETGARVIGVSAMMFSTAVNIKKLRSEIDTRGYKGKIQLAVGGAIFKLRPELVSELGGDGTADSALEVSDLFTGLKEKSLTYGDLQMNKKERIAAVLRGEKVDRHPVSILLSLYGAKLTSCPLEEYYTNFNCYVEGQIAGMEKFDSDVIFSPFKLVAFAESFGAEIIYPKKCAPNVSRPAAETAEGFKNLSFPDIDSNPSLVYLREAVRGLRKKFNTAPIGGIMLTPADLPAVILGIEKWLEILLFDADNARMIMDRLTEHFIDLGNALIDDGADFIIVPAAFSNPGIITEKIARDRIIPVLNKAFKELNAPVFVHSASIKMGAFAELYSEISNVPGLVIDSDDSFEEIRNSVGRDKVLIGNIDGPQLKAFTPEEIEGMCKNILEDRKNDRHFILGTSRADIDYDTPEENLHCIIDTVRKFD